MRLEQYLASIERLEARWTCSLISRKRLRGILDQSRPNSTQLAPPSTPSNQGTFTTSVDCSIEADYPKDDDEVLADEARFLEPEAIILSDILDNAEDASDDGLEAGVPPIEAPVSLCPSEHPRTPRADQDNAIKSLVNHSDPTDRRHIALNKGGESTVSGRLASIHWALPVSVRCFFHLVRVY